LEAQVGQFLLGCKCPVSRFFPGRAKDLINTPVVYRIHYLFHSKYFRMLYNE
jgi:hypothetical protein